MDQLDSEYEPIKRRPLDFRRGIIRKFIVKRLLNHPKDNTVTDPTSPASPLLAARLTSPNELQILHSAFLIKIDFLGQTEINDVLNSNNCYGAFSDICRNYNLEFIPVHRVKALRCIVVQDWGMAFDELELGDFFVEIRGDLGGQGFNFAQPR